MNAAKCTAVNRLNALKDCTPESHRKADTVIVEFLISINETAVVSAYRNACRRCGFEYEDEYVPPVDKLPA